LNLKLENRWDYDTCDYLQTQGLRWGRTMYEGISRTTAGVLTLGGVNALSLVERFGTPLYVLNEQVIRLRCSHALTALQGLNPCNRLAYAGKAFLNIAMCQLVAEEGLHLDVVSGGELHTALRAGFPPERIYFHGNNKLSDEIVYALSAGVGQIVVDNLKEIEDLNQIASQLRLASPVRVLIRVTPDVLGGTHSHIETGGASSKFGLSISRGLAIVAVRRVRKSEFLSFGGIHCHIGSQITSTKPFFTALSKVLGFARNLKAEEGMEVAEFNMGGGLGVPSTASEEELSFTSWAEGIVSRVTAGAREMGYASTPLVTLEPGRYIAAPAGVTLYTVGSIKASSDGTRFAAVDGGMGDNPRPALYNARYEAVLVGRDQRGPYPGDGRSDADVVTLVGKYCESGDVLVRDAHLPGIAPGDIVAVLGTGAYNFSMASNYNRLPRPAMVFVSEGASQLVVRRETYDDIVARDQLISRQKGRGAVAGNS